jgi:hypothetical protein
LHLKLQEDKNEIDKNVYNKLEGIELPSDFDLNSFKCFLGEMQVNHKLYKGVTTYIDVMGTTKVKQMSLNPKLFLMYVVNQILMGKVLEAQQTLKDYAYYFEDLDIVEAGLACLYGLSIIMNPINVSWDDICLAIKSYLKASIIYKRQGCVQGMAICKFSIGFILFENIIDADEAPPMSIIKYIQKKISESVLLFRQVNNFYAMCICFDILLNIKKL